MALKLMGKKRGMIQLFDKQGNIVVGTVIEAEPNIITQIKTKQTDGYNAIQLGFEQIHVNDARTIEKRVKRPQLGFFKKNNIQPRRFLSEAKLDSVESYQIGQEIGVDIFADIQFVDATAISKGKGYQGVMKLHNFSGGPASHGSGFHRHAGSTGMRSTPGRSLPNSPRASHMGYDKVTVQNLEIVMVKAEDNVIIVKGQVPGPKNGLVCLSQAKKKHLKNK